MRSLICILGLFVASFSYASNIEIVENNTRNNDLSEEVECVTTEFGNDEVMGCQSSTTSTVTTNPDGSSTRTTTTTVSCDTPQELAQFHALMAAIGMGV